ncbi:MAG TPA: tagaturonate epimerase family protein [Candidatus Hydrogenedentes bacterium]|nr:tagaturonate epimerase family protein [Candidatus Hydrogenedentota bacterium]
MANACFVNLTFDPGKNPAVLDTCTWDAAAALHSIRELPEQYLDNLVLCVQSRQPLPRCAGLTPYTGSLTCTGDATLFLAGLPDGQAVFLEVLSRDQNPVLGDPLTILQIKTGERLSVHPTDADTIVLFIRRMAPLKGPRALGSTPRLGIGVRMTTACWPAILKAMEQKGFCANLIQNSVRELNFMSTLLEATPAETNYACGFGTIETGYTGSSFEGLWVAGVLEALKYPKILEYGADADHLQVKRGAEGMAKAKRYVDSCRHYSFYTMDMADILDYAALTESSDAAAEECAVNRVGDSKKFHEVLAYHRDPVRIEGRQYVLNQKLIHKMIGKYWNAMLALEELSAHIHAKKNGQAFDLEFTIDEHSPEVAAFDCLTSEEEVVFVLNEIKRRTLPVSHIAPNFGVEKGFDYRCPDGLEGLERRIRAQFPIAEAFGVLLDFHSADDLTSPVREVIRRATGGKHHYKISPMLQILFAKVLEDHHPDLFRQWWEDARAYAEREAAAGSPFARACIEEDDRDGKQKPSHRHKVFHHFSFAFVGRRDKNGQFLHRDRFYDLSQEFYQAYEQCLITYLVQLAEELF